MVDADGKPLMVNHGTTKNIDDFSVAKSYRHMSWFTADPAQANQFVAGGRRNMGAKPKTEATVYPV